MSTGTHHFLMASPVRGGRSDVVPIVTTTEPATSEPGMTTTDGGSTTSPPSSTEMATTDVFGTTDIAIVTDAGTTETEDLNFDILTDESGSHNTNSLVVPIPAGNPGDVIYISAYRAVDNGVFATPVGWNSIYDSGSGLGNISREQVIYRVADGSEGSSVTLSYSSTNDTRAVTARVVNGGGHDAITGTYVDGNSNTMAMTAVVSTVDEALILAFASYSNAGAIVNSSDLTTVASYSGATPSTMVAAAVQAVAGSSGTKEFDSSTSAVRHGGALISVARRGVPEFAASEQVQDDTGTADSITVPGFGTSLGAHRYWRVWANKYNGDTGELWVRLKLMVAGTEVSNASMTWTSTSNFGPWQPNYASNPPTSPGWGSDFTSAAPQGLSVDLGSGNAQAIDEIRLTPISKVRAPGEMEVFYSDDGSTWHSAVLYPDIGESWVSNTEQSFVVPTTVLKAGDVIVATVALQSAGGDVTPPDASWTLRWAGGYSGGSGPWFLWSFFKKADVTDFTATDYTFTFEHDAGSTVHLAAFHGALKQTQGIAYSGTPLDTRELPAGTTSIVGGIGLTVATADIGSGKDFVSHGDVLIEQTAAGAHAPAMLSQYKTSTTSPESLTSEVVYSIPAGMIYLGAIIE